MKQTQRPLTSASFVLVTGIAATTAGIQPAQAQHVADPENGKAVYEHWCSHCHDGGRGMTGTQSLQIKYDGEVPAVLLERDDLSAEAIKTFVRQGVQSMPPFRKTEITEQELEDLAAYMTR